MIKIIIIIIIIYALQLSPYLYFQFVINDKTNYQFTYFNLYNSLI
jgi:hypothetical protein